MRLIGVGVSGLEDGAEAPTGIDRALDRIADRYGDDKITRGLALERKTRRD